MATKKKKRPNIPRVKRMKRKGRLQSAVSWLAKYEGKRYIRGYRKHFGVDVETAIAELTLLGVPLSDEIIRSARSSARALVKEKQQRKEKRKQRQMEENALYVDCDETYAYIAGYTSGGFAFGVTWEDMERYADQDSLDDTLPPHSLQPYIEAADEREWLYIVEQDAREVPFDLDVYMNSL